MVEVAESVATLEVGEQDPPRHISKLYPESWVSSVELDQESEIELMVLVDTARLPGVVGGVPSTVTVVVAVVVPKELDALKV